MTAKEQGLPAFTLAEVAAFLDGSAPLDGAWFGEIHRELPGKFWWRKHLRAALASDTGGRGVVDGDKVGFICGACGAAHKDVPIQATIGAGAHRHNAALRAQPAGGGVKMLTDERPRCCEKAVQVWAVCADCEAFDAAVRESFSAPPESGGQGEEPIGWVFQHEETGRMTFCANDGTDTPEDFQRRNKRYVFCSAAYTHPPAKASGAVTEAMVEVVPVVVSDAPDAHRVQFVVGTQQFHIGPDYFDTRAETEFFASMFRQALAQGGGNER